MLLVKVTMVKHGRIFHIDRQGWVARNNIVRNQSGILICGIATYGFSVRLLLENTFSEWIDTPKLGVVLGDRPYYMSRANINKSFKDNLKIKQNLETRFIKAGCVGTVTIHGDVSELGTSLQTTDDIGKFEMSINLRILSMKKTIVLYCCYFCMCV